MNWLIEKWDWFIYHRAYNSLRRLSLKNPGFAYLIYLHLHNYIQKANISDVTKRSTESFYRSLTE